MTKQLFLIGGTMGVGKTANCQVLKRKLNNSVFLDGDWCWDMHPFQVTEETKEMVLQNICFILNNFIKCSVIENVVFCWVMHQQEIIDEILSRLDTQGCKVHLISLKIGSSCKGQSITKFYQSQNHRLFLRNPYSRKVSLCIKSLLLLCRFQRT